MIAVLAVIAAIGSDDDGPGDSTGDDGFRIVAYQGRDVLGGDDIGFASLLGTGTPVVLNFWAALCPPCRQEMPSFQRVYDEHKGEFILVGVDVGPFTGLGSHDEAREFLEEFNITYPAGFAVTSQPLREFDVVSMPTTIFFDGDGRIVSRHAGFLTEDQLESRVEGLLALRR